MAKSEDNVKQKNVPSNGLTKEQAKEQERQIDSTSDVRVFSQEEIEQRQKDAKSEDSAQQKAQTNRGLDNSTRPGGGEGESSKVYKDERIQPSDTNAPDAGQLPDGTVVAK